RLPWNEIHDEPRQLVGASGRSVPGVEDARNLHARDVEEVKVAHLVQHARPCFTAWAVALLEDARARRLRHRGADAGVTLTAARQTPDLLPFRFPRRRVHRVDPRRPPTPRLDRTPA